ncbi:MAG: hypothetical protein ACI4QM_00080, partial [Alphaproteobacteria bacterium]
MLRIIGLSLLGIWFCFLTPAQAKESDVQVSAFVRVKDEINTIIPSLNSIDGIFDRIIIIHSNEQDDGSVQAMQDWCSKRSYCLIFEYPHAVIPSHDKRLATAAPENTLAAYYQFGLEKFNPEEYVCKIDGDQIYLTDKLKKVIEFIRRQDKEDDKISYGISGYNTFIYKGQLVKWRPRPINGGTDCFIIKRKYLKGFRQSRYYEKHVSEINLTYHLFPTPLWFHFQKTLKAHGIQRQLDEVKPQETIPLSKTEKQ